MSKCSVMCNKLQARIRGVSGLNDKYVWQKLCEIDKIIDDINDYADEDELNGSCFGKNRFTEEDL